MWFSAKREDGPGVGGGTRGSGRKRRSLAAAAAILMVAVAVLAASCGGAGRDTSLEPAGKGAAPDDKEAAGGAAASRLTVQEEDFSAASQEASSSGTELPEVAPKIIKTGKASLELERGEFHQKRGEVYFLVESAGGYIQSESTGESGGATRGTFLLRIPSDRFDQVFPELARLGKASDLEVATQDVTQEYIDLEGRIRHLEAEEQFYLGLISQARTIQEMISIRERLDSVQLQKEQALGRKNYLDRQISYSLITLNMAENQPETGTGRGFWGRVADAFKSFGRACRELLVGLAYALPYLAALALLILLVWAAFRKRRDGRGGETGGPSA